MQPQDISTPDPTIVLELLEAFRRSKTMFAAVSLGVFDALVASQLTAAELARQLSLEPNATERLLNACVGLGLLQKFGEAYANSPQSTTYLTQTSPRRMTGYIQYSNDVAWKLWANLEGAIREGHHRWQETYGWEGPIFSSFFKTDEAAREFLMGMNGFGVMSSPAVVNAFDLSRFKTLVDLGGATGHLVTAACQRYSHLQGVLFDLPDAVGLAQEMISNSPQADRITVVAGDFFKDPLPPADLYALGRILHDWTTEKGLTLLTRIYDALPSGGGLLIAEKMLSEDKTGPRWAQMQDLNMLVCTEGRERTLSEYSQLLAQVGFKQVQGCRCPVPIDAILAIK